MRYHDVAVEDWSMGRSCDAPECGRVIEGRGSRGLRAWLLGHRYCSHECRWRAEYGIVRPQVASIRR